LVINTLDPDSELDPYSYPYPDPDSLEMLDPDPYRVSGFNESGSTKLEDSTTIGVLATRLHLIHGRISMVGKTEMDSAYKQNLMPLYRYTIIGQSI
jgi:hypothetical protein